MMRVLALLTHYEVWGVLTMVLSGRNTSENIKKIGLEGALQPLAATNNSGPHGITVNNPV
eukprot:scaffold1485_cov171-Amphora_coffeaeformis.AAC.6